MKKKDKTNDTSTFNKKKSLDKNIKKIELPPTDKEIKSPNLLNIIQEKKNNKTKIVKIQGKNYNSFKPEKSPERRLADIGKYDKIATNIKTKKTDSNLNSTSTKTSSQLNNVNMHNSTNSKKKQISPKIEFTVNSCKLDQIKTNLPDNKNETEKSTLVPMTSDNETSIYNQSNSPNMIYSHYNKGMYKNQFHYKSNSINSSISQNQSKIRNSLSIEYTIKIIDLMEKMKNFLIISSQNQSLLFNKADDTNSILNMVKMPIPTFGGKHTKKNLSEDFDLLTNKLYLELNRNNDFIWNNKINRFYSEIDCIYKGSSDLNETVKNNMYSTLEISNESIRFESTRVNLESINQTADKMECLYHKLFNVCKDCMTEIKTIIFESYDNEIYKNNNSNINQDTYAKVSSNEINPKIKKEEKFNEELKNKEETQYENNTKINYSKSKTFSETYKKEIAKFEIKSTEKPTENVVKFENNSEEKNKMINDKLEMLKNLKEKKEQILGNFGKTVKFDENTKMINKTMKNGNMTEIDPSEINENVIQIQIPQSNICEVNKPVSNNNYKQYTSEAEENIFPGDSQIILHFDDYNNDFEDEKAPDLKSEIEKNIQDYPLIQHEMEDNIEKTLNDTVIETGNSFMKNHRRSRSQVIQKQLYTYSIKPQEIDKNFNNAKIDLNENYKNENDTNMPQNPKEKEKNVKNNSKCIIF